MIGHSTLKTSNDRVQLSEIFTSIEGEGPYFGTKTIFVRMAGCHLNCHWCDTTYALAMNSGKSYSVDEVKDLIIKELRPNTYKINFYFLFFFFFFFFFFIFILLKLIKNLKILIKNIKKNIKSIII